LLREHREELLEIVKARGGRVANFPHCPRCASFHLYRENNRGSYECQSCELRDIEESIARRTQ
jgi:transposase-like protein